MFQHILVPLDGSTRAEAALPVAARLAQVTSLDDLQGIDIRTEVLSGAPAPVILLFHDDTWI